MHNEPIEKDVECMVSAKGLVMLTGGWAYHEFENPHAMRKARRLLKEILDLAKRRGYRGEKEFRAAFAKPGADDEKVTQALALFEYIDSWDVFSIFEAAQGVDS